MPDQRTVCQKGKQKTHQTFSLEGGGILALINGKICIINQLNVDYLCKFYKKY